MARLNIDDDEPPALVDVGPAAGDGPTAVVDEDLAGSGPKVPITIVTGYLGAGSKTRTPGIPTVLFVRSDGSFTPRDNAYELHTQRTAFKADSCNSKWLVFPALLRHSPPRRPTPHPSNGSCPTMTNAN